MQNREPLDALGKWFRGMREYIVQSKLRLFLSGSVILISWMFVRALLSPSVAPPAIHDMEKLSTFSVSFEPLVYYSENGRQKSRTLLETSSAVWDLGESIRGNDMISAPIIVEQLVHLSDSIQTLSDTLTKFGARVDGDIDYILISLDLAKRRLQALPGFKPDTRAAVAYDNFHLMLSRLGSGAGDEGALQPTVFNNAVMAIFGPSSSFRVQNSLARSFLDFIAVLEDAVDGELTECTSLFSAFDAIDLQFLNLQRATIGEEDVQEQEEGEMLSSLWSRVLGPNAALVRKYEKNRRLLAEVRSRTRSNKDQLMEHRNILLDLQTRMKMLRRKLASPLVRPNSSATMTGSFTLSGPLESEVRLQVKGLDMSLEFLRGIREKQKMRHMEEVSAYVSKRRFPPTRNYQYIGDS